MTTRPGSRGPRDRAALAAVIAACAIWGASFLFAKVALGAIFQLPVAWLDGAPELPSSALGWAALLALGFGCTAGSYALWNRGLERVPASRAGVYLNLEPVVGATLGVLLLREPVTAGLLAGGGLILAASILASIPVRSRRGAQQVPLRLPEPARHRARAA